jgi:magnesium-transporting ATPase (P-type)
MESFFTGETIGLLTAALLVLGTVKFILYYKAFNVEVLKYIESSEVIVLFADNISVVGSVVVLLLAPYVYTILPHVLSGANEYSSLFQFMKSCWFLLIVHIKYQSILAVCVILFSFTRKKITNFERLIYFILSFAIIIILPFMTLYLAQYAKEFVKPTTIIAIALILNFLVMVLAATGNEIYKVKSKGYFLNTKVEFEEGLEVPKNAYYIGQVKGFIFFYEPSENKSITFKTDKIKSVVYQPYISVGGNSGMSISQFFLKLFQRNPAKKS